MSKRADETGEDRAEGEVVADERADHADSAEGSPPQASIPPAPETVSKTSTRKPLGPNDEADSPAGDEAIPDDEALPKVGVAKVGVAKVGVADVVLKADRDRLAARMQAERKRLMGYLRARHGLPEHAADDILQEATTKATRSPKHTWPAENAKVYPWARAWVNYERMHFYRTEGRNAAREKPVENIDDHVGEERPPEDERAEPVAQIAGELARYSATNRSAHAMLMMHAEGHSFATIAGANDLTEEAAKKRVQRFARAVRERWSDVSTAMMVAVAVILMLAHRLLPQPAPIPVGSDPDRPLPVLPTPPPSPAKLRVAARRECDIADAMKPTDGWLHHVGRCQSYLDRAATLDPNGDTAPKVKEMRDDIYDWTQGKGPRVRPGQH